MEFQDPSLSKQRIERVDAVHVNSESMRVYPLLPRAARWQSYPMLDAWSLQTWLRLAVGPCPNGRVAEGWH